MCDTRGYSSRSISLYHAWFEKNLKQFFVVPRFQDYIYKLKLKNEDPVQKILLC